MKLLRNILLFVCLLFSLSSLYGAYPEVEFNQYNDSQLTFTAWSGTQVDVKVNGESVDTYTIRDQPKSVVLTGVIEDLDVTTGTTIDFLHFADGYTYDLNFLTDAGEVFWQKELSGGQTSTRVNLEGEYLFVDNTTQETKVLTVSNKQLEKTVSLPNYLLLDGENIVEIETTYYDGLDSQSNRTQEFSFNYEKFSNDISVEVPTNFTKTPSITVNVSVEDDSLPYYYIINQDGDLSSCSFTQNQFFPDGGSTELTIPNLYSGENTIRIISTLPDDCTIFSGEERFKVTLDKVAPRINLYEASIGVGSSAKVIDENQFSDTAYLNENSIKLAFDSDASVINYTLNGRGEGPLVENQVFDQVDWIDDVEIDSTGNRLTIDIYPLPEFSTSYVKYSYDGRDREEEVDNGVISLSINLDEDDKDITFRFYEGSGPDVIEDTMDIYDLAFEDKGRLETAEFDEEDELFIIQENLDRGRNVLRLFAYDEARNLQKRTHIIEFDDTDPEIDFDSLDPQGVFSSGTSRSPILNVEGKTNKGGVEITAFAIPEDTTVFDSEGNPREITCSNRQDHDLILRSLGQLDNANPGDSELNLDEQQITLSLGSLLSTTPKTTSNSQGEFEDLILVMQEKNFDRGDFSDAQDSNPDVGEVSSRNEICFATKDKFGNTHLQSKDITFDAGNTLWTPGQVTLTPSTVYAAEIEQTGDQRGMGDRVQFGVLASFSYNGDGRVTNVDSLRINPDSELANERELDIDVLNEYMNYYYDENSNELIVYFQVEIAPLDIQPLDYPEELPLDFQAEFTYDVDDTKIPIDTTNPVYFGSELNIERPLDHAKWLSPSTIDDGLDFLEESINFTKKAVEWTRTASIVGVVACTGTRLYYQTQIAIEEAKDDPNQQTIDDYKEKIFYVCDRVACSASPSACNDRGVDDSYIDVSRDSTLSNAQLSEDKAAEFISEGDNGKTLGRITSLRVNKENRCTTSKGEEGVLVSFDVETYQESSSPLGFWKKTDESTQLYVRERCVPAEFTGESSDKEVTGVSLQDYAGACYTDGAPNFDQTRCLGAEGWDPANNIIESLRCGCITDTYSHLQNLLKVQTGIKKCLEEAKLGVSSGAYCERLMSQAVCDVATNLVFMGTLSKVTSRTATDGSQPHDDEGILQTLAKSNQVGDQIINERYDGTMLSEQGMSTEQIVNNVCLGAATGDWSALQDSVLTSIEENQVDPIIGPAFPWSRMMGVNPFTGELTVQYRFTHAIVSGGQNVRTRVNFVCDASMPGGDYCPPGRNSAQDLGSSLQTRTLVVREDQTSQDTIVMTDESARFRYNVLELTHEYTLDNNEKEEVVEERILPKTNGLLGQCHWNGGLFGTDTFSENAGIVCDRLFTDDTLLQRLQLSDNSKLLPEVSSGTPVFYPGNNLKLFAEYSVTGGAFAQEAKPRLYYKITCEAASGSTRTSAFNNVELSKPSSEDAFNQQTVNLLEGGIPEFAIPLPDGDYMVEYQGEDPLPENIKIQARYTNDKKSGTVSVLNVVRGKGEVIPEFTSVKFTQNQIDNNVSKTLTGLTGESLSNLRFLIDNDIQGVIELDVVDEDENVIGTFIRAQPVVNEAQGTQLDNLGVGACTLDTRVLTSSMAQGLTEDNFDSFSPQNMNLTNVESANIKTFKFNLARNTDDNHVFRFDVLSDKDTYCVDEGRIQTLIKLEAPIVSSNDNTVIKEKIGDSDLEKSLLVSFNGGRYSFENDFFIMNKSLNNKQFNVNLSQNEGSLLPQDFTSSDLTLFMEYSSENSNLEYEDSVEIRLQACESEEEQEGENSGNETDDDSERENEEGIGS